MKMFITTKGVTSEFFFFRRNNINFVVFMFWWPQCLFRQLIVNKEGGGLHCCLLGLILFMYTLTYYKLARKTHGKSKSRNSKTLWSTLLIFSGVTNNLEKKCFTHLHEHFQMFTFQIKILLTWTLQPYNRWHVWDIWRYLTCGCYVFITSCQHTHTHTHSHTHTCIYMVSELYLYGAFLVCRPFYVLLQYKSAFTNTHSHAKIRRLFRNSHTHTIFIKKWTYFS